MPASAPMPSAYGFNAMLDGFLFDLMIDPASFDREEAKRICRLFLSGLFPRHFAGPQPAGTQAAALDALRSAPGGAGTRPWPGCSARERRCSMRWPAADPTLHKPAEAVPDESRHRRSRRLRPRRSSPGEAAAPRSIALVGASPKADTVGHGMIRGLRGGGFKGRVYAINPNYREIEGIACYPSLAELPERVDHALLGVANARLEAAHAEAVVAAGIPAATILASGYLEGDDTTAADPAHRGTGARRRHAGLRRQRHGLLQSRGRRQDLRLPAAGLGRHRPHRPHQPFRLGLQRARP